MKLPVIFDAFAEKSPLCVIAQGVLVRLLEPKTIDEWYSVTAKKQYSNQLLFSSVIEIMGLVVHGGYPSVQAAYLKKQESIPVSLVSVYNKLNGIEPHVSAGLVRFAYKKASKIIKDLLPIRSEIIPGLKAKIIDGNCIEASDHRIKELRPLSSATLPGKSLVVYDPVLNLPCDYFPCEDGHAQERSLFKEVIQTVRKNDLWIADRNFCTNELTCTIDNKRSYFVIREHGSYSFEILSPEKYKGVVETGKVYEQKILVKDSNGQYHEFRRIRLNLDKKTRDGAQNIYIISNLPENKASAKKIVEIYRGRWQIETAFLHLSEYFNSEINTLGYPPAALFTFAIALVAYMVVSIIKASLMAVHGRERIHKELSSYYVADELSATHRGMLIAIPFKKWLKFRRMKHSDFITLLKELAEKVDLKQYKKSPRKPKKPVVKNKWDPKKPHVSIAKILAARKK